MLRPSPNHRTLRMHNDDDGDVNTSRILYKTTILEQRKTIIPTEIVSTIPGLP